VVRQASRSSPLLLTTVAPCLTPHERTDICAAQGWTRGRFDPGDTAVRQRGAAAGITQRAGGRAEPHRDQSRPSCFARDTALVLWPTYRKVLSFVAPWRSVSSRRDALFNSLSRHVMSSTSTATGVSNPSVRVSVDKSSSRCDVTQRIEANRIVH
jgi:hypothetical protein